MMRSPRTGYGRVNGIYDTQGSTGYGRLGLLTEGRIHHNSHMNVRIECNYIIKGVHRVKASIKVRSLVGTQSVPIGCRH